MVTSGLSVPEACDAANWISVAIAGLRVSECIGKERLDFSLSEERINIEGNVFL